MWVIDMGDDLTGQYLMSMVGEIFPNIMFCESDQKMIRMGEDGCTVNQFGCE